MHILVLLQIQYLFTFSWCIYYIWHLCELSHLSIILVPSNSGRAVLSVNYLVPQGDDTMTGDGGEYLRAEDLRELGDDSLPGQYLDGMNYLRFSLEGGRTDR